MLVFIKKIIPKFIFKFFQPYYHKILAYTAAFFYGHPSNKLIVIGVTGTNGKSTTTHLTAKILEAGDIKTGETSTVFFKVGEKEWLNDKKMTMLGRFALQKMISQMVKAGCRYAVIETSSEGIKQFRHLGVNYDIAVFTNLTPEHLESHGSFENYKKAKLELFKHLEKSKYKKMDGKKQEKVIIANLDDEHSKEFLNFQVDKKIGYSVISRKSVKSIKSKVKIVSKKLLAANIEQSEKGSKFTVNGTKFNLKMLGEFNIYNALAGIAVGLNLGLEPKEIKKELDKIIGMPGRMEIIDEGQDFNIIVDYAPEPESMKQLYKTIKTIINQKLRIIHVLGSCGGGRDVVRRPVLGNIAGKNADYVIVTNEDPYDDDPMEIINNVADGAIKAGKILNKDLFKTLDRREAIKKALTLAEKNDVVLITGKGSEQAICVAEGKKIPWDDRKVVREELQLLIADH